MNKTYAAILIVAGILIAVAAVAIGIYNLDKNGGQATPPDTENQVMCTMEAKLCPDGSYVGREGPDCEFAACPGEQV